MDWMIPLALAGAERAPLGYRLKREFFKTHVFKQTLLTQS